MEVAVGFKFCPTEKELVLYLFGRNVRGESLREDVLEEFDIYESEPWNLFTKESSEVHYVFTKLKKNGKCGGVDRTAGCRTWDNQASHTVKDYNGSDTVLKKYLVFQEEEDDNKNGSWVMQEFSLLNQDLSDYVLCEIRNKGFDKEARKKRTLKRKPRLNKN